EQRREEGYPDHPGREDRSDRMAFAGGALALGGALEYLRIVGSAAYPEDQQRRQDARPDDDPPAEVRIVARGNPRAGQQRRQAGAHGGAAMSCTERLAAVPRVDDLAKEHGADRPFSAEAEPLEHTKNEQLLVVLREARQEGENREPQDRQLQDPGPAVAIAQPTADPAADRGREEVGAGNETRLDQRHAERSDEDRDQVRVDDPVGHIHRPAGTAGPEDATGLLVRLAIPVEHCHARRSPDFQFAPDPGESVRAKRMDALHPSAPGRGEASSPSHFDFLVSELEVVATTIFCAPLLTASKQ